MGRRVNCVEFVFLRSFCFSGGVIGVVGGLEKIKWKIRVGVFRWLGGFFGKRLFELRLGMGRGSFF